MYYPACAPSASNSMPVVQHIFHHNKSPIIIITKYVAACCWMFSACIKVHDMYLTNSPAHLTTPLSHTHPHPTAPDQVAARVEQLNELLQEVSRLAISTGPRGVLRAMQGMPTVHSNQPSNHPMGGATHEKRTQEEYHCPHPIPQAPKHSYALHSKQPTTSQQAAPHPPHPSCCEASLSDWGRPI